MSESSNYQQYYEVFHNADSDRKNNFMRKILHTNPNSFLVTSNDMVYYSNPLAKKLIGIKEGDKLSDFYEKPIDFEPSISEEDYQHWVNVKFKTTYGEIKIMHMHQYNYYSESVKENLILVWLQDVTKMNQAVDTLRSASENVQEISNADKEMHLKLDFESRKCMNSILGLSSIALDTEDISELKAYIKQIQTAANSYVNELNKFFKPSKTAAKALLSLNSILQSVSRSTKKRLENRELSFELIVQEDIPDKLIGNGSQLGQVLVNLIKNSIGFTISGGIVLRVTEFDRYQNNITLLFAVSDTGIGMEQDKLDILFPQFSDDVKPGNAEKGLGIATCRTLVSLMGGRMWCESELDKGTTVFFTISCEIPSDDQIQPKKAEDAKNEISEKKYKVLVVDDDKVNCTVAYEILRRNGFNATVAESGVEAIDILKAQSDFDVILMDVYMPDMDGLTTTKVIREMPIYKNVPVIALTATAMKGDKELCLEMGMDDYLVKPFITKDFLDTVFSWANNRKM